MFDKELNRALQKVPGFDDFKPLTSNADCLERSNPFPQFDKRTLSHAFPPDWRTRSDDELRAFATIGLENVHSDQFKAMTPEIIVSKVKKRIDQLNRAHKRKAKTSELTKLDS